LFEISDDAKEFILVCLEKALEGRPELRRGPTRIGLRLNFHKGGAYLSLAFPRPTDSVVTFMNRPLLIVGPEEFSRLERTRLTIQYGPGGGSLSVEPCASPQALQASEPPSLQSRTASGL
jgi:hypothetical protein